MKSVPSLLFFRVMKDSPTEIFEKPTFEYFSTPLQGNPVGWYCYDSEYPDEGAILYKPPYRPGEKCYIGETVTLYRYGGLWEAFDNAEVKAVYADGEVRFFMLCRKDKEAFLEGKRLPVTMPQWAARRFVTIVSCEPIRVEKVTEEDAVKMGLFGSPITRDCKLPKFRRWWAEKHPGKSWAWRTESVEVRG